MAENTSSEGTSDDERTPEAVSIRLADGNTATLGPVGGPICMQFKSLPGPWQYHVDVTEIGGVPGIVHLCIQQQHFTPSGLETPITSKGLRTVPVGRFLQGAREALHRQHGESAEQTADLAPPPGSRKWPNEHYLHVAQAYWKAEQMGQPPREAIAKRWKVTKVTASRWLRRARELGYLDPYEPHRPHRLEPDPAADHADYTWHLEAQIFRKILASLASTAESPVREKAKELSDAIHEQHTRSDPNRPLSITEWILQGPAHDNDAGEQAVTISWLTPRR